MVSLMAVFRYLNPFWWAYAVTLKPIFMLLGWVFSLPWKLLKMIYPSSFVGKVLWWPAALWVLAPGTNLFTIFWALSRFGFFTEEYEQSRDWLLNNAPVIAENLWSAAKIAWAVGSAVYGTAV